MIGLPIAVFAFAVVAPLEYGHLGAISSAPTKVKLIVSTFFGLVVAGCVMLISNVMTTS